MTAPPTKRSAPTSGGTTSAEAESQTQGPRTHFFYRAFDAAGRLLYVAATIQPSAHWQEQANCFAAPWRDSVARFKVTGPITKGRALELRRVAVANDEPLHNFTASKRRDRIARNRIVDEVMRDQLAKGHDVDLAIRAGIAVADVRLGVAS